MLANRFMTLPESFESMIREMDQALGDVLNQNGSPTGHRQQAPVALWEEDDKIFLEVAVPGVRREDLNVTVHDGKLIISGRRQPTPRTGKCWYNEQFYGSFERVIALSDVIQTDAVDAELSDGVLSLTLQKKPEAKPYRVAIGVRDNGGPTKIESESAPATNTAGS